MSRGVFITIEGIEGSGKSTQARLLAEALRAGGRQVTLTREPGGTRVGEAIRALFLDPATALDPVAEVMLVLADRAQHVCEKLAPALAAGAVAISDRYGDSTVAYQGYGRGFDLKLLGELNRLASSGIAPDLTILLDCPVETGLLRTRERAKGALREPDRFEGETLEFHRRVREGFRTIAAAEPGRVTVVDSTASLESVQREVRRLVEEMLRHRCL